MLVFQDLHVPVQGSQKLFDRLPAVLVLEGQGLGYLDLVFEVELIAFSAANMMKPISYVPDE
jgi:hypothetical protein